MAFGVADDASGVTTHLTPLLHLLGEYSLKILNWEEIGIRDRSVLAILVEIHPDHTLPLDEDLQKLATDLGIDIASEYQAFDPPKNKMIGAMWVGKVHIASSKIESSLTSALMGIFQELSVTIQSIASQSYDSFTALSLAITLPGENLDQLHARISALHAPITLIDASYRGQRLFVFDMDSTVINEEVIDLLALKSGKGSEVAAVTESAMRGEIDFPTSLKHRVNLLAGLSESVFNEVRNEISLTAGAIELFAAIHRQGDLIAVVSGGFHNVIDQFLNQLDVDFILGNMLEVEEGVLTGKVSGRVIDAAAKGDFLTETAQARNIPLSHTIAIGDGANDREMVTRAGTGIAFCAKPALIEVADVTISERNLALVIPLLQL